MPQLPLGCQEPVLFADTRSPPDFGKRVQTQAQAMRSKNNVGDSRSEARFMKKNGASW